MSKISIIKAKVSDAQAIRKLETSVWGEEVVNKYDAPGFVRFGWCFVALAGRSIIGAICSYPTKDGQVYVCDWVVRRTYRQRGVGELLYQRLLREVKGKTVISFIDPKNGRSLNAHKKFGFKVSRSLKNAYGLNDGLKNGARLLAKFRN